jgi:hypothetical protein
MWATVLVAAVALGYLFAAALWQQPGPDAEYWRH